MIYTCPMRTRSLGQIPVVQRSQTKTRISDQSVERGWKFVENNLVGQTVAEWNPQRQFLNKNFFLVGLCFFFLFFST